MSNILYLSLFSEIADYIYFSIISVLFVDEKVYQIKFIRDFQMDDKTLQLISQMNLMRKLLSILKWTGI